MPIVEQPTWPARAGSRNRLSLLLQLTSPKKYTQSPMNNTHPHPLVPPRISPSLRRSCSAVFTTPVNRPALPRATSVRMSADKLSTPVEPDTQEREGLLKRARKLSRISGEDDIPNFDGLAMGNSENGQATTTGSFATDTSPLKRFSRVEMGNVIPSNVPETDESSIISHSVSREEPLFPSHAPRNSLSSDRFMLSVYVPSLNSSIELDDQSITSATPIAATHPALGQLHCTSMTQSTHHSGSAFQPIDGGANSTDRPKSVVRRVSLDLALSLPLLDETIPSTELRRRLKRSRSLWIPTTRQSDGSDTSIDKFQQRYHQKLWEDGDLGARQRVLNVKRARKLAQVFGQEPPCELIQILDEKRLLSKEARRDSVSTFVSFSSNYLLPTTTTPSRDRSTSTSTVANELAASSAIQEPTMPRGEVPLPIPFGDDRGDDQFDPDCDPTTTFRDRRRRAAKLTRFFGVKYQDLSPIAVPRSSPYTIEVNVKVGRRKFWDFTNRRMRAATMPDVLDTLRSLKAA